MTTAFVRRFRSKKCKRFAYILIHSRLAEGGEIWIIGHRQLFTDFKQSLTVFRSKLDHFFFLRLGSKIYTLTLTGLPVFPEDRYVGKFWKQFAESKTTENLNASAGDKCRIVFAVILFERHGMPRTGWHEVQFVVFLIWNHMLQNATYELHRTSLIFQLSRDSCDGNGTRHLSCRGASLSLERARSGKRARLCESAPDTCFPQHLAAPRRLLLLLLWATSSASLASEWGWSSSQAASNADRRNIGHARLTRRQDWRKIGQGIRRIFSCVFDNRQCLTSEGLRRSWSELLTDYKRNATKSTCLWRRSVFLYPSIKTNNFQQATDNFEVSASSLRGNLSDRN